MNYRFSNLSGRIIESAGKIGKNFKNAPAETPEIVYVGAKFTKIDKNSLVQKKTRSGLPMPPAHLIAKYKHFQVDNGVPVHLKGGSSDYVLFGLTVALTAFGLVECARFYYEAAMPKKND